MSGRLLDEDPELAYKYSQEALRRAGRIDVVREAAGIAAYVTERYAEALRELRTVRRLTGSNEHLPLMADAERGLGRPEKALELANSPEADTLDNFGKVELAIVASGARADLGEYDAALATLDKLPPLEGDLALRVLMARAAVLQAAGKFDEAKELLSDFDEDELDRAAGNVPDPIYVYETFEEPAEDEEPAEGENLAENEQLDDDEQLASDEDSGEDDEPGEDDGPITRVEATITAPSENPDLKATWIPAPEGANDELHARLEREQGTSELNLAAMRTTHPRPVGFDEPVESAANQAFDNDDLRVVHFDDDEDDPEVVDDDYIVRDSDGEVW